MSELYLVVDVDHVGAIPDCIFNMLSWLDWMEVVTVVGAKYA